MSLRPHWTVTVTNVTATSERNIHSPESRSGQLAQRSAFGTTRGIPWWAAFLLPLVLAALCAVIDTLIWSGPGVVFTSGCIVGTLLAVMLVQRGSLFGPMVQPPLVVAIVIPSVVWAMGVGFNAGDGLRQVMLSLATPLINSFPAMAAATAVAILGGLLRIFVLQPRKRRDGNTAATESAREERSDRDGRGSRARGAERASRGGPGEGRESTSNRGRAGTATADPEDADDRAARRKSPRSGQREQRSESPESSGRRGAPPGRGSGPRTRSGRPPERTDGEAPRGSGRRERDGGNPPNGRDDQRSGRGQRGGEPPESSAPNQDRRPAPPGRGNAKRPPREGDSPGGSARRGRTEPPGRPRRPRRDEG
ncbi:hypothetical protein SAMN04487819_101212 [Actinopolyspora alba]|uniref:DUF6542 domain-containing protein n=1 Tax=Actinopolyspora alba TaxID=673379 RepID=A0A1I1TWM2_9ACTN|nr:hypothetical protein SAMN04487819_101212 [Actinopolyspora alba]